MPYKLTAELQQAPDASIVDIVAALGDWSDKPEDSFSFAHEGEGEYVVVRTKDGSLAFKMAKGFGVWWNRLTFNLMMWAQTLQWCTAQIYNDRPGHFPTFYKSNGFQRGSAKRRKFEKNRKGWIHIALEWWQVSGSSLAWYLMVRDTLASALGNDPESRVSKTLMREYAVRERWDIMGVQPGPSKYDKDVFDERDAASFGGCLFIIIHSVITGMQSTPGMRRGTGGQNLHGSTTIGHLVRTGPPSLPLAAQGFQHHLLYVH